MGIPKKCRHLAVIGTNQTWTRTDRTPHWLSRGAVPLAASTAPPYLAPMRKVLRGLIVVLASVLLGPLLFVAPAGAGSTSVDCLHPDIWAEPGVVTHGTDGDDVIFGTDGADVIYGGEGNDTICGFAGNDTLYGGPGNDRIHGMAGWDELFGQNGNDDMRGGPGNDYLVGGDGNDTLRGEGGHDRLIGWNGNDWLHGNDGNDTLRGGGGNDDKCFGYAGTDRQDGCELTGTTEICEASTIQGDTGRDCERVWGGINSSVTFWEVPANEDGSCPINRSDAQKAYERANDGLTAYSIWNVVSAVPKGVSPERFQNIAIGAAGSVQLDVITRTIIKPTAKSLCVSAAAIGRAGNQ